MNSIIKTGLLVALVVTSSGCQRIETGHVGLRIGFDRQVSGTELQPGSFNQTLIGNVIEIPVKDVAVQINDLNPLAKDNSTMKDFDAMVIYNVNPSAVSELYTTKNKSFHATDSGDTILMYNYIMTAARNAIFRSARNYDALVMSDAREAIQQEVKEIIVKTLNDEGLTNALTVSQVLVRNITPADSIVQSANELVKAKNTLKQKEIEVQTAQKEADRISILNSNKGAIEYMNAMATMNISEGIKEGKVNTIVVPIDFKGIVNTK